MYLKIVADVIVNLDSDTTLLDLRTYLVPPSLTKSFHAHCLLKERPFNFIICLLNVSVKICTKVGTNRLTHIAHSVVQPSQTVFMPGQHILEGVAVLHERLHEIHSEKLDGVIFKVDFEKACDKVKWPFLQLAMRMKGFSEAWRNQVDSQVQKGSVGIKVNDDIGHYFQTHKGLRQGNFMSPLLFNIVADMLAILIGRA